MPLNKNRQRINAAAGFIVLHCEDKMSASTEKGGRSCVGKLVAKAVMLQTASGKP